MARPPWTAPGFVGFGARERAAIRVVGRRTDADVAVEVLVLDGLGDVLGAVAAAGGQGEANSRISVRLRLAYRQDMVCGKCDCGKQMVAITNGTGKIWRCTNTKCTRAGWCDGKPPTSCDLCSSPVQEVTVTFPDGCLCDACKKYVQR
jgi:hypothetical protein